MQTGQATNDESNVLVIAKCVAKAVTSQPHYWRGHPETLQVSKKDLETDIAFEVAIVIRALLGIVSGT